MENTTITTGTMKRSILEDYKEVSEGQYNDMLCVLPPIWGEKHNQYLRNLCDLYPVKLEAVQCFQVGEASDSENGRPTFDTYAHVRDEEGKDRYFFIDTMQRLDRSTCKNPWNY